MAVIPQNFLPQPHPLGPIVIFSYGMTKCGSTLAFELARSALELSGYVQPLLPDICESPTKRINFTRHLKPSQICRLMKMVRDVGHPIVIKTHSRPDPCVIDMINAGQAIIQASYRDPREMALSMMDHGMRARAEGKTAFADITSLQAARKDITSQLDSFAQWLYRPNCLPLYYEDLAFDRVNTTRRITAQLHLPIPPEPVIDYVNKCRFTQFNKGRRRRYRTEMAAAEQKLFKRSFRPLYKLMIRDRDDLPVDGCPILSDGKLLFRKPRLTRDAA